MTRKAFWAERGPALIEAIGLLNLVQDGTHAWYSLRGGGESCYLTDAEACCILERVIERRCAEKQVSVVAYGDERAVLYYVQRWANQQAFSLACYGNQRDTFAWKTGATGGDLFTSAEEAIYAMAQAVLVKKEEP